MNQSAMAGRSTKAFDADATLVVVVEMSRSVWLVAGLLPGIERRPLRIPTMPSGHTELEASTCSDLMPSIVLR